ncbi:hypothetical protein [uncultured Alistipes sp.]|uniref:hypothetical protein n=1 Tax=uncultured Alistipes sp. TaxID=538949 RepID=UPI0026E0AEDF|nr:hypothetical protein [uncultured Alistipes sp.]
MTRGSDTKSFVLRVDAATMEALEEWAADEFRSINGQLQWIVADALRRSGRTPARPGGGAVGAPVGGRPAGRSPMNLPKASLEA